MVEYCVVEQMKLPVPGTLGHYNGIVFGEKIVLFVRVFYVFAS